MWYNISEQKPPLCPGSGYRVLIIFIMCQPLLSACFGSHSFQSIWHLPENGAQLLRHFKLQPQSRLLYVFKPCVHACVLAASFDAAGCTFTAPVSLTCSKLSVKSARFNIPDAFLSQPPVLLFMYQLTLYKVWDLVMRSCMLLRCVVPAHGFN